MSAISIVALSKVIIFLHIVGCYESYILAEIDTKTGQLMKPIGYNQGVFIFGCSFKSIIAYDNIKRTIYNNGGII